MDFPLTMRRLYSFPLSLDGVDDEVRGECREICVEGKVTGKFGFFLSNVNQFP